MTTLKADVVIMRQSNGGYRYGVQVFKTTWREVVTRHLGVPDTACIYLIHDDAGEIVYIGKSRYIQDRLCQHLGFVNATLRDGNRGLASPVGGYVRSNEPASRDWAITILDIDEHAERGLICYVNPYFNDRGRTGRAIGPTPAVLDELEYGVTDNLV